MAPNLTWERIELKLRNPFRLSYGVTDTREAFWIRLADDAGWGEGTIAPYYKIDPQDMIATWEAAANKAEPFPNSVADIPEWVGKEGPVTARCAIDLALYDRIGKSQGVPLFRLLGVPRPRPMPTSFTIAIDTPEAMARMAADIKGFPMIKVKLGSEDDLARLAAIRAARPDAKIRVDANSGWTRDEALERIRALDRYELEMIEQPLPWDDIEGMGMLQKKTRVPIIADESVQTWEDVEKLGLAGVGGVNIKLMKVGGLTPSLRLVRRAREMGMKVMLGCMVETTLGTTAMAHLAGLADWLDLDAPMLISNDPFDGLKYDEKANVSLPDRPGIGVVLKSQEGK
ncbi:MAG TPA: dipeptide epimerase [Anaerolineaceae bacterium]|nr:dipeptide epimerase [Anaerolineaceae bacterium]